MVSDDSEPTFSATFTSMLTSLRPDRALASKKVDSPRELFKHQYVDVDILSSVDYLMNL